MGAGNAQCRKCCYEEKKGEVDLAQHVPSYPAPTSYVTYGESGLDQGHVGYDSVHDPAPYIGGLPPPPASPRMAPPQYSQEGQVLQMPTSPGGGNAGSSTPPAESERNSNRGKDSSPRTAADWAKEQEQFAHLPPLPPGWIRACSKKTGAIYYCCKATGQTTFTEPKESQAIVQSQDLPPGWVELTSRSTGKQYFWNVAQQRAQYEKPTEAAVASGDHKDQPKPQPGDPPLPPGWVAMISRGSGKTYYFNSKLQKSQYDIPTESA